MKLSVAKSGVPRYFTAKLGWKEQFDPREMEMLSAGTVPMLIPPLAVRGKHNNVMEFDVTPYSTLEFYLTCVLSREQLVELLERFVELFRRMQEVYLNYKNLVLAFDQIYVSLQDRSIHLIYLPLRDSRRQASLPEFFQKLAKAVNASTYEQVNFLNQLNAFLSRPAPFTLSELQLLLREGGGAPAAEAAPEEPARRPAEPVREKVYVPPVAPGPDSGGTVVLWEEGGTVSLEEETPPPAAPRLTLERRSTGERVTARGEVFRLGKEAGQVDYCIADNRAVSRSHAELLLREGRWWARDLKSTNKTYLNGRALTPGEAEPLENGMVLKLANEEFSGTIEE